MYSINEKLMADDRAIIALVRSKENISTSLKPGMIAFSFEDKQLYPIIARGQYYRILQEDALNNTIAGNHCFGGNITINGNLNVLGDTTYINTKNLNIEDNIIELNKNENGNGISLIDAGIMINRGSKDPVSILFSETNQSFNFKIGNQSIFSCNETDIKFDAKKILFKNFLIEANQESTKNILTLSGNDTSKDNEYIFKDSNKELLKITKDKTIYYNSLYINDDKVALEKDIPPAPKTLCRDEFVSSENQTEFRLSKSAHVPMVEGSPIPVINVFFNGLLLPKDACTFKESSESSENLDGETVTKEFTTLTFKEAPGPNSYIIVEYFN